MAIFRQPSPFKRQFSEIIDVGGIRNMRKTYEAWAEGDGPTWTSITLAMAEGTRRSSAPRALLPPNYDLDTPD